MILSLLLPSVNIKEMCIRDRYTDTLKIGQSCTLKAITIRPNGSSAVLKEDIKFNKATMKPITMQIMILHVWY